MLLKSRLTTSPRESSINFLPGGDLLLPPDLMLVNQMSWMGKHLCLRKAFRAWHTWALLGQEQPKLTTLVLRFHPLSFAAQLLLGWEYTAGNTAGEHHFGFNLHLVSFVPSAK